MRSLAITMFAVAMLAAGCASNRYQLIVDRRGVEHCVDTAVKSKPFVNMEKCNK